MSHSPYSEARPMCRGVGRLREMSSDMQADAAVMHQITGQKPLILVSNMIMPYRTGKFMSKYLDKTYHFASFLEMSLAVSGST